MRVTRLAWDQRAARCRTRTGREDHDYEHDNRRGRHSRVVKLQPEQQDLRGTPKDGKRQAERCPPTITISPHLTGVFPKPDARVILGGPVAATPPPVSVCDASRLLAWTALNLRVLGSIPRRLTI
jgi:hypothetical protein